jgi:hypothetical protein
VAAIACDLAIPTFRTWWDHHSLSGSIVSSLLVLGVAGLIVDEVVSRRQRRDRASLVAVQALIVYTQTRRAYTALVANADAPDPDDAGSEIRILASMILTASPSLFDDPSARLFLEEVQRLGGAMYRVLSHESQKPSEAAAKRLAAQMAQVDFRVAPLSARLPAQYRSSVDDSADAATD